MNSYDTATPYIAAYVIIRRDGKVGFVYRTGTSWMNNYYGLPSGKVEKGETYTMAAIREAAEEIGIAVKAEDLKFVHAMHRHEELDWVDVYFEAAAWEGEPHNAEEEKHSEFAWLDPKNLPNNVIPSVVAALEYVEAGQVYSEFGWE